MESVLKAFSDFVGDNPEDILVLTCKVDLEHVSQRSETEWWAVMENKCSGTEMYILDTIGNDWCRSVGIHKNGKHKRLHGHIHYLIKCPEYQMKTAQAYWNQRNRFSVKNPECDITDVQWKYQRLDPLMPVWQTLAYPLKEGIYPEIAIRRNLYQLARVWMGDARFSALLEVGKTIYSSALALLERQEAHRTKKLTNLQEIYVFAKEHKGKSFNTFKEMRNFLEDAILGELSLEDMPIMKNYNNNIFIVGQKLGLVRYADYDP